MLHLDDKVIMFSCIAPGLLTLFSRMFIVVLTFLSSHVTVAVLLLVA